MSLVPEGYSVPSSLVSAGCKALPFCVRAVWTFASTSANSTSSSAVSSLTIEDLELPELDTGFPWLDTNDLASFSKLARLCVLGARVGSEAGASSCAATEGGCPWGVVILEQCNVFQCPNRHRVIS